MVAIAPAGWGTARGPATSRAGDEPPGEVPQAGDHEVAAQPGPDRRAFRPHSSGGARRRCANPPRWRRLARSSCGTRPSRMFAGAVYPARRRRVGLGVQLCRCRSSRTRSPRPRRCRCGARSTTSAVGSIVSETIGQRRRNAACAGAVEPGVFRARRARWRGATGGVKAPRPCWSSTWRGAPVHVVHVERRTHLTMPRTSSRSAASRSRRRASPSRARAPRPPRTAPRRGRGASRARCRRVSNANALEVHRRLPRSLRRDVLQPKRGAPSARCTEWSGPCTMRSKYDRHHASEPAGHCDRNFRAASALRRSGTGSSATNAPATRVSPSAGCGDGVARRACTARRSRPQVGHRAAPLLLTMQRAPRAPAATHRRNAGRQVCVLANASTAAASNITCSQAALPRRGALASKRQPAASRASPHDADATASDAVAQPPSATGGPAQIRRVPSRRCREARGCGLERSTTTASTCAG